MKKNCSSYKHAYFLLVLFEIKNNFNFMRKLINDFIKDNIYLLEVKYLNN